jgi:hypothetical protein
VDPTGKGFVADAIDLEFELGEAERGTLVFTVILDP